MMPLIPSTFRNYRDILRSELVSRIGRNPSYSLRAYARDLGILPSHMSQVLNNKKGISPLVAKNIASKLNLSSDEQQYFLDSVESAHGKNESRRENARARLAEHEKAGQFQTISLDHFALIADWYHFAILEIMKIEAHPHDLKSIAKSLGITKELAGEAIARLRRVGLLENIPELKLSSAPFHGTGTDIPAQSIKLYHEQILNLAIKALYEQNIQSRDFSAITIAIDKDKIPAVKAKIKKFQEEMDQLLEASPNKSSVYCLSIQFFDLLKIKK